MIESKVDQTQDRSIEETSSSILDQFISAAERLATPMIAYLALQNPEWDLRVDFRDHRDKVPVDWRMFLIELPSQTIDIRERRESVSELPYYLVLGVKSPKFEDFLYKIYLYQNDAGKVIEASIDYMEEHHSPRIEDPVRTLEGAAVLEHFCSIVTKSYEKALEGKIATRSLTDNH